MANVTKDEIKRIAKLAKLELSESELSKFEQEFNDILGYISKIQEVDVSGIEFEHNIENHKGEKLAEDLVKESLSKEKAIQNATKGRNKNGYFRTSKIVNKEGE